MSRKRLERLGELLRSQLEVDRKVEPLEERGGRGVPAQLRRLGVREPGAERLLRMHRLIQLTCYTYMYGESREQNASCIRTAAV